MPPGPEADPLYLDRILAIISTIQEELNGIDDKRFLADRNLSDATALRLGAIGEFSGKLSGGLKARHPRIDWTGMTKLRNIVAHHYDRIEHDRIWAIATHALSDLESACRAELDAVDL